MSGGLALSHGANDAQKVVGVVALLLLASGEIVVAPGADVGGTRVRDGADVGTAFGGWPIIRTIGARIVRLRPIDALASQTGSTAVLLGATLTGAPVSTTQVVASSVVGVGVGKRPDASRPLGRRAFHADRLVADGSRDRTHCDRGTLSLEVARVSTKRWFLPDRPSPARHARAAGGDHDVGHGGARRAGRAATPSAGDVVRRLRARSGRPEAGAVAIAARRVLASARRRGSLHVVGRARRGAQQREGSRPRDGGDEPRTQRPDPNDGRVGRGSRRAPRRRLRAPRLRSSRRRNRSRRRRDQEWAANRARVPRRDVGAVAARRRRHRVHLARGVPAVVPHGRSRACASPSASGTR